jgi:hypothetical protein
MLICALLLPAYCQISSPQYQPGTIVAVAPHPNSPRQEGGDVIRYDVSVKVGNTVYMTLYTPPNGYSGVEFSAGIEKLFLVGSSTLTFNSASWGKTEVPIVRQQRVAAQSGLDWAKAPGQYFSMMLRILSESLMLSDDQKTKIKPILEQETSECGQFWANPVVSPDQKLREYGKIVRSSDEKLKFLLTPTQLQQLQEVRAEQSADLKKVLAEQKASNNN